MHGLLLAGLLALPLRVIGHPVEHTSPAFTRRSVDLDSFRLPLKAQYEDSKRIQKEPSLVSIKAGNYVDTATKLVKELVPDATYRLVGDHYVGTNGVGHVNFRQTIHDIDLDNGDINVNIGKDGKVLSYGNSFYTGKMPSASPLQKRDFSDPVVALKGAASGLQLPLEVGKASAKPAKGEESFTFEGTSGAVTEPKAKLVYFEKEDGELALTWKVETDVGDNWLLSYVDASAEDKIYGVVDYVASAEYEVYPWGINDPTEGERSVITDPWNDEASEFTWHGDGTDTYTTTRGNNGIAQENADGDSGHMDNYRPDSSNSSFRYPYTDSMSPPSEYRDASITQLFYTANMFHDLTYALGFTEEAGNFEVDNNGQGGNGNDAVILNSQDGSGTNNANFATPPDGQAGRMRMYTWTTSTPNRDGCFDAGIVIHEFAHGLSNRLTGGPANSGCLNALESGGMGEGWGDFLATAARLKDDDTRDTDYPMGAWAADGGIRTYPYSTNLETNPHVYTDNDDLGRVHAIGTVWATMLYEVLWNLVDEHGLGVTGEPKFDNGVPADGRHLAMKLAIDGMALQPCNPNFVQARDAIMDADTALTGGANLCSLWTAFAKRGLGEGAKYGSSRTGSDVIPDGVC